MENDHSPDARRKGEENPISLRPAYLTDPEEAEKDAASREAIARKLAEALDQKGAKALVGNRGYAQFLKVSKAGTHIGMSRMLPTERESGMGLAVGERAHPESGLRLSPQVPIRRPA
jgi:hypothetical protein